MHTHKDSGDFEAETNTRSEATGEVLRLIVEQIQRLQRERVNERELADAKAYMTGSFPLTIETPDAIATQVLNVLFYGLPVEELQSFRDRVNAVTPLDIERVARFYLMPDRLSIVLVGNAAAFASQLRSIGFGSFETVEMDNLDLTSADFKRLRTRADGARGAGRAGVAQQAFRPAVSYQSQPATRDGSRAGDDAKAARALLEQVVMAKGGVERLRSIRTLSAVTRSDMPTPSGNVAAEVTTYLQYPNRVRVETRLAGASIVQVYDGTRGWIREGSATHDVPPEAIRELEAGFRRDTVLLLLAAYDGTLHPRVLPDAKDEAGKPQRVLELSGLTLDPVVLFVDRDTNLIVRQTYVAGGPGQPLIEETFGDYQIVDGVQIAFRARVRPSGQPALERRVTDIRINPPLEARLFTRPGS